MNLARLFIGVLAAAIFAAASAFAQAAETVPISVDTSKGYARIVFAWPKPVAADATIADGVLVITFARPFQFEPGVMNLPLDGYVSVIRQDPSGRTLRLSLAGKFRVQKSIGGRLVAVDLVPMEMAGFPDVIQDPAAKPAGPRPPVDVRMRIAVREDRTRLTFEWGERVDYKAEVKDGTVKLAFAREGKIDVGRLNNIPPAFVKSATSSAGDDQTLLEIHVDPGSPVEHFRDKTRIVIDVKAPRNDKDAGPQVIVPEEMLPPPSAKPPEVAGGGPDAPPDDQPALRPGSDGAAVADAGHDSAAPEAPPAPTPEPAPEPSAAEPAAPPAEPPQFTAVRARDEITLTLPALADAPAAMFRRGDRIVIAVKGMGAIDTARILRSNADLVLAATTADVDGVSVLTLTTAKPLSVTAGAAGGGWTAVISPDPLDPPRPVALLRDARTVGPATVRATLARAGAVIGLADPLSGERLVAVLAGGEPQGVIGARSYVEFAADATAQGLLIRPFIDDLTVTPGGHDVVIGAPAGLTLSAGTVSDYAPDRAAMGDRQRPAAMDFAAWTGAEGFVAERSRLLAAITPENAESGRLALARFYLAHDLGPEALGVLQMVVADDEAVISDPVFRALRGAALILTRRFAQAEADLASRALDDDPAAQLLRGQAAAGLGKWGAARDFVARGETALADFRPDWQARFRIAGARGAIETNAVDVADRLLGGVPAEGVPQPLALEAQFLSGQLAERLRRDGDALRHYGHVRSAGYRPLEVRAALAEIALQEKTGALSAADAIAALDKLRWQWRGDEVELSLLRRLGNLQIATGDYRNGLQTLRAAVLGFPRAEDVRRIQTEMSVVFEDLFLNGKADALPPIQALGLYYDFKELTPIGTMGDEMVRRLADRLIAVDLLEQAAELLQHQVDRRLDGVAKAQISAKLAAVYLMDRKPQKALAALRASSQTRLPEALAAQRRLLSARALSDLKQYDAALEAFDQDDTPEARRLRADVLWAGSRWAEVAAAIEILIDGRHKLATALDGQDRYDILRAAIAYTMADDDAGLKSLRDRFVVMMAETAEAAAFEVVTRAADPGGVAFRDMAKSVAGIDTLDAFLRSLGLGRPAGGSASN